MSKEKPHNHQTLESWYAEYERLAAVYDWPVATMPCFVDEWEDLSPSEYLENELSYGASEG